MTSLAEIRQSLSSSSRAQLELSSHEHDFRLQLEDLCGLAQRQGIHITPHSEGAWKKFRSLDNQQRIDVYSNFLFYRSVCDAAIQDGQDFSDDISLLWYAIKKLELRPRSDFFDKIQREDIIEVYDRSFLQIFRNFNFFEVCSYSLADIFTWQWQDLYIREPHITAKIAAIGTSVLFGSTPSTLRIDVEDHYVEETFGPAALRVKMTPKYFSPLFDKNNQVAAVVATSRVSEVASKFLGPTSRVDFLENNGLTGI